ncbi:serine protease inhibitor Kazal-type 1 [Rousettus aegyptiacus]|uniref:Serine protease inhibitor Kazal-type 1 n=1 Tax=Rousettus aegyptiacus TaxID=9407 RepID=A0A7J8FP79_ROUAE|nr:serine protease inhibitor Kazal-type 1 [Rousettus aegyptiacus]KAF6448962.1 serine peptidase inhibitor Kazal type 1 [Rousettus aegyptiacus]
MKVTGILLLIALALMSFSGNARADVTGRKAVCTNKLSGCPRIYNPVCGTNGITYTNECELCMENKKRQIPVLIKKDGRC